MSPTKFSVHTEHHAINTEGEKERGEADRENETASQVWQQQTVASPIFVEKMNPLIRKTAQIQFFQTSFIDWF